MPLGIICNDLSGKIELNADGMEAEKCQSYLSKVRIFLLGSEKNYRYKNYKGKRESNTNPKVIGAAFRIWEISIS